MLRKTSRLLVVVLLCSLGLAHVSAASGKRVKTGRKRDTLLYVSTDPPGAKVLFNGKELGTSDGLFRIKPGKGTIFIELEGCQPDKREVIVRAGRITRLELSLQPEVKVEVEKEQIAPLVGHLLQGTVELVGVTNYPPNAQSKWWKPDGSATDLGPFLPRSMQLPLSSNKKPMVFLLRLKDLPSDASWPSWDIEPYAGRWEGSRVLDVQGKVVPNYKMFCAELGASARTAKLRVGVSAGAWASVIIQKADSLGTSSFSKDGKQWTVTFLKAEMAEGLAEDSTRVTLTSTDSYGIWHKRLVAVSDNGIEYTTSLGYRGNDGTALFQRLPLSSIKEFRFQVRPYDWVEFKNVSLQPGQKTAATAVSFDDSANTEK